MSARCDRPIELAALVDYWFEEQADAGDDAIERHLLECESCSGRLRGLVVLGDGVRQLAHAGAIEMVVAPSFLERARREGLRIREYRMPPGGSVVCTVAPEDDLIVGHIEGDFKGTSRLDLVWQGHGAPERRIQDVPVNPDAHELVLVQSMPVMRRMGVASARLRVVAPEPHGPRLVGEYTFNHEPSAR
jgi:hypothetical protein